MPVEIHELDVRGLSCPMPLLKTKKGLNALPAGALLRVFTTDPGSVRDFRVFCTQSVHDLLEVEEREGEFIFLLKRG